MQRADGTGPAERLTKPDPGNLHVPESWSPDGNHISSSVNKGGAASLWVWSRTDKTAKALSASQSSDEPIGSAFSPDGRWIAYHWRKLSATVNFGDSAVSVQPFPATGRCIRHKGQHEFHPLWSPDGKELIYVGLAASGQLAAVSVSPQTMVPFGRTGCCQRL